MNPCPYCGAPMANPRRKQCGAETCLLAHNAARQRAFFATFTAETGLRYEDRYKVECVCSVCGLTFRTRHRSECCRPCQRQTAWHAAGTAASNAASRARAEARRLQRGQLVLAGPVRVAETLAYRIATARADSAATGTRSRNAIWVGANCRRCGGSFVCMWTDKLPQFCSRPCARSTAKAVRRGRERGGQVVHYSRHAIFERDRWTCRLCSRRVKRTARVPDPLAPVIDHIVPLAAGPEVGGVDAPWNVQCAHFLCNSIKRDQLVAPALF